MDEKSIKEFSNALADTVELVKYFPDGYDFGINDHDPAVDDLVETLNQINRHEQLEKNNNMVVSIMRGIKRHVTIDIKYDIYEKLDALPGKVWEKDKELIHTAMISLEDMNIPPGFIGLVFELYRRYLFNILLTRSKKRTNISPELINQVKKSAKSFSERDIKKVIKNGENALELIESMLYDNRTDETTKKNIFEIACRIPCHHSARLVVGALLCFNWSIDYLVKVAQENKLVPLVAEQLLNELDKKYTDFYNRWLFYDFLATLKDHQIVNHLRKELTEPNYWHSRASEQEYEVQQDFYEDIAEWLIEMDDRRAIPALVKLIHTGIYSSGSRKIVKSVQNILKRSKWHMEIARACRLLSEEEIVIIEKDKTIHDILEEKANDFYEFHRLFSQLPPTITELQERINVERTRWNEAYHEDMDGLRPIDIPIPQVNIKLLQRMADDFDKEMAGRKYLPIEKTMQRLRNFQTQWLITPLPDYNGRIPIAIIMEEEEKLANTVALEEHFKKYKNEKINSLYLQSVNRYEEGDLRNAKKLVEAVLQIEPGYPFARRLKRQINLRH